MSDSDDQSAAGQTRRLTSSSTGATSPPPATRRYPTRIVELVLLGLTLLLAVSMVLFLVVDWYRFQPWLGASAAATLFDGYLAVGEWIDFYLGSNVFWLTSTWRSMATAVLIGIAAPLLGVFLIHRQMALIGETLAHAAFAGVAVGVLVVTFSNELGWVTLDSGHLLYVALIVAAVVAIGLQWLTARTESYGDVPIAIVLSGSFAVGTLLIHWGRDVATITVDIEAFLFGSIAIVTAESAQLMALLTVLTVAVVATVYKQLLFITFDERAAEVAGISVGLYNVLLIVLTAVVVVGAMQIMGVILVAAMLVVPAATASALASSFRETVYIAIIAGQLAVIGGMAIALLGGLPPGGSIVVVGIGGYLVAVLYSDRSVGGLSIH